MGDLEPSSWQRIKEAFGEALDLAPEERSAFLDRKLPREERLRAEVDDLLRRDLSPDARFARPVFESAAPWLAEDPRQALGERRIGSYRTLRELGRGGMGEVYLAERADGQYRQRVAIKQIRGSLESPVDRRRFQQERQILANLEHPNIARLLDGGVTEDDQPYLVMEYVEGKPLDLHCDNRRLSLSERLDLFRRVCAAVHHAHRHLVVHCDLKPGNILVTSAGEPKLLDFGVAKLLGPEQRPPSATNEDGVLRRLTPEYASPEQLRGEPLSTASDVYSLGVLLYVLLTGQHPFRWESRGVEAVRRRLREQDPAPPSAVSLAPDVAAYRSSTPERLRRQLLGDLDAIVLMALAKNPGRRYGSAAQLAEDLRRHQGALPVTARRDTLAYRSGKFLRRNRWAVSAGILVATSLLAGIATATWQAREAEAARFEAEEVTAFLERLFHAADPSLTRNPDLKLRSFLDDAARQVPAELASQPETQGRLLNLLGEGYRRLGLYEESRSILEQAFEIRTATFGEEHPAVAETLDSLGLVLLDMNEIEESERLVRRALGIVQQSFGEEHLTVAESLNSLGLVLRRRGDSAAAEPLFRRSLELRRRFLGQPQREVSVSLNNLGLALQELGRLEPARQLLEEALDQQIELYGQRHWLVANTRQNLALVLVDLGRLEEAEAQYREALASSRDLLGPDHPRVAAVLHNLADLLQRQGDGEAARESLEEAIAINQGRGDDVALAANLNLLGNLLYQAGAAGEAEAALQRCLDLRRKELGPGHPHFANALHNLVYVLRAQGSLLKAETPLRAALAAWESEPPPREWDIPYATGFLGWVLIATGRGEEGRPLLERGRAGVQAAGREDLLRRLELPKG